MELKNFVFSSICVAFGGFNGVHRGHQKVLKRLKTLEKEGLSSLVITFDHSTEMKNSSNKTLCTFDEKKELIKSFAPMLTINYNMDTLIKMEPKEFIEEILIGRFNVKVIVAGKNCMFGAGLKGDYETLLKICNELGLEVIGVDTEEYNQQPITSEWIIDELENGSLQTANELLGYPYSLWGEVVEGKQIGRTVGMPTANLRVDDEKLIPKHGVYAAYTEFSNNKLRGLTNIGLRPSVDDHKYVTIETFILNFSGDLYGKRIKIELHSFIRGVRKFKGIEDVKNQVDKDIKYVNEELNNLEIKECLIQA